MFRYRTNFYDLLRLRAKLVRDSTKNVTAAFLSLKSVVNGNANSNKTFALSINNPNDNLSNQYENYPTIISSEAKKDRENLLQLYPSLPAVNIIERSKEKEFKWKATRNENVCGQQNTNLLPTSITSTASNNALFNSPTDFNPVTALSSTIKLRTSRIVGGDAVLQGEFPWMVSKTK